MVSAAGAKRMKIVHCKAILCDHAGRLGGHGGGLSMDTPERSSDRKTFAFLAGIAALGLSMAAGVDFAVAKLEPTTAPLRRTSIFDPYLRGAVANYPDAVREARAA